MRHPEILKDRVLDDLCSSRFEHISLRRAGLPVALASGLFFFIEELRRRNVGCVHADLVAT